MMKQTKTKQKSETSMRMRPHALRLGAPDEREEPEECQKREREKRKGGKSQGMDGLFFFARRRCRAAYDGAGGEGNAATAAKETETGIEREQRAMTEPPFMTPGQCNAINPNQRGRGVCGPTTRTYHPHTALARPITDNKSTPHTHTHTHTHANTWRRDLQAHRYAVIRTVTPYPLQYQPNE